MDGQRYRVMVELTFEVHDEEAVRRAAWDLVADQETINREGSDTVAERMAATPELALSHLVGRSGTLDAALFALAREIGSVSFFGKYVAGEDVHPVDEW